jgi:hypothetical protein
VQNVVGAEADELVAMCPMKVFDIEDLGGGKKSKGVSLLLHLLSYHLITYLSITIISVAIIFITITNLHYLHYLPLICRVGGSIGRWQPGPGTALCVGNASDTRAGGRRSCCVGKVSLSYIHYQIIFIILLP